MFTGLIEAIGDITEVTPTPSGFRLRLATALARELVPGDSLSVNGGGLPVVSADSETVDADIAPETARVTILGMLQRGSPVNLERPLRADARLGGHFVQGHVDATGSVEEIRQEGDAYRVTIAYPPQLAPYIVRKGSIAVNGISLTVAGVDDRRFDVQVIPFTWTRTTLHATSVGDLVNLECDIVGKYVVKAVRMAGQ